jgi:DNA primase
MLYSKSRQLYGLSTCKDDLDRLRREQKKRNVVVMEGYTDVVVSRQAGVANPVAVCGTALTEHHVTLVSRFADQLTLMFDGDKAGTDKAKKLIELYLGSTIELRVATPPGGLDPCDFVLQHGAAEFEKLVANSVDALDFSMDEELKGIDVVNDSIATSKACGRIIGMLAQPQAATSRNPEFRVQFQLVARRIARRFRLEEATVKEQLSSRVFGDSMRVAAKEDEPVAASHAKLHGWEVGLFTLLIQDPDAISAVIENVGELDMRTETGRNLLIIYQDLEAEGRTPDFETVMASIEDSGIKAVLVELVEEADRKQGDDTELQLRELMGAFNGRRDKKERRHERARQCWEC